MRRCLASPLPANCTAEVFDSIVEFAGIGDFIYKPLRTYSSGMTMRLAVAVAVHVDPDILIIDEVLGVSDSAFHNKCLEKIHEFHRLGKRRCSLSRMPPEP